MTINEIRKTIDRLDSRIVSLLNERMEQALMVGKLKARIEDKEREEAVLARIQSQATELIAADFLEGLYREIIRGSKNLQDRKLEMIAFQGEHGAYSEGAARAWNPDLVPLPCREFTDLFEGVESGLFNYGLVPVENTLGGIVGQVNDLLISTELHVVGAVELPIHHCLLALPETDHREIRMVYSHEQALAQCRRFLMRNRLEPARYYDTAGAAKMLAEKRPPGAAVIAGRLAARLYQLEIIKENIEDHERNRTRFLVLSREENREAGDKCSVIFSTEHKAGTLFQVLEVFAREDINLTRIESIPDQQGSYAFFLDFMGSNRDPKVQKVMEKVEKITTRFRIMGCYPERRLS